MMHLRTTHLRIVLHYHTHHYHTHPEGPQTEAKLDVHRKLYTTSEGDLARAAARFFSSMAALQYLFLTTCGYITVERNTDTDGRSRSLSTTSARCSNSTVRTLTSSRSMALSSR